MALERPKSSILQKVTKTSNNPNGRPKGSANMSTQEIADKLAAYGCDPLLGMAQLAMDPESPRELRGKMYSELTQYIHAKRRAMETTIVDATSTKTVDELRAQAELLIAKMNKK